MLRYHLLTVLTLALPPLLAPLGVAAQEPPDSIAPSILEPLRVTILRSGSPTTLAPYAISVLNSAQLVDRKAGFSIEEAVDGLPGVQVQNRYNFAVGERISIRGFGSRSQFGVRGIRALVDGIPATVADGQSTLDHLDISSLGRVEVVRGPAASIYGNAAGGVLDFASRLTGDEEGEFSTVVGSDGLTRFQGTVGGQVGVTPYRVSVSRLDYDGFRTDDVDEGRETYGHAHRWTLNGSLAQPLGDGELRVVVNGVDLRAENPGSMDRETLSSGSRAARAFNVLQRAGKTVEQGQIGASWKGLWSDRRVEGALYGVYRDIRNPIPGQVIDLDRWAGGGRLLISDGDVREGERSWTVGGELDIQSDDRRNFENEDGADGALTLSQLERVRSAAGFGQLRIPLGRRWVAMGGLRYDRIRFEAEDRFIRPEDPNDSGSRTLDRWSPSVGLTFAPSARIEFFVSASTSFETPTTTELANRPSGAGGFNPELEPQTGKTYEAGLRAQVGRVASLEVALFRTALDDQLLAFEVPENPGRTFFRNAGSSVYRGGEIALSHRIAIHGRARVSYSRVDATFDRFSNEGMVFDGNDVPGVSPSQFEGSFVWAPPRWSLEVAFEQVGAVPVDDANSDETGAYVLFDLRGEIEGVELGPGRIRPVAGINNVFDRSYLSSVAVNAFGNRFFEPGPGRTMYFGLTVAWDRR